MKQEALRHIYTLVYLKPDSNETVKRFERLEETPVASSTPPYTVRRLQNAYLLTAARSITKNDFQDALIFCTKHGNVKPSEPASCLATVYVAPPITSMLRLRGLF